MSTDTAQQAASDEATPLTAAIDVLASDAGHAARAAVLLAVSDNARVAYLAGVNPKTHDAQEVAEDLGPYASMHNLADMAASLRVIAQAAQVAAAYYQRQGGGAPTGTVTGL